MTSTDASGDGRSFLGTLRSMPVDRVLVWVLVAAWTVLILVPLLGVVAYSFLKIEMFTLTLEPDFSQFSDLTRAGRWAVIAKTLEIATIVTLLDLVVGIPFAYWLSKVVKSSGTKSLILGAAIVPFFLSVSSRTIVWRPLLGTNGLVNTLLLNVGLIDEPITIFLFSDAAVIGGLAITYFPSVLFPVFLAISLINDDYLAASRDLGAGPLFRAWTVVLPLALPGIVAGTVFTFVPVLGEATIPQLLGGGNVNLLSKSVMSAFQAINLNVVAAMCTVIFACLGLLLVLLYLSIRHVGGLATMRPPPS